MTLDPASWIVAEPEEDDQTQYSEKGYQWYKFVGEWRDDNNSEGPTPVIIQIQETSEARASDLLGSILSILAQTYIEFTAEEEERG